MSYSFLIVDDTSFMRKMAADSLKHQGYIVAGEAANGKEAVQKFKELKPDVVMMDLTMPEMNGLDAIKEIFKIDKDAVILVCSASNQKDMIQDALEAGAVGYLMKPFKPDYMNEIIKKYAMPHLKKDEVEEFEDEEEVEEVAAEAAEEQEEGLDEVIEDLEKVKEELEVSHQEAAAAVVTEAEEKVEEIPQSVVAFTEVKASPVQAAAVPVKEKPTPVFKVPKPVRDSKIKMSTSYICNWEEDINGEKRNFAVTYTENDQNICFEMTDPNHDKQTIQLSLDGFLELYGWLEQRLEEGNR
ncbi:DNA-binding NarL/FixJ family response regulator [Bacillus oleivorans]|uniref:DNA-binding NarL/FixJ family response regulator n=1 Tax=Bacillus oleivorans TaxID=1448271 RepID=A0A285CJP0_9BACI|nr:DNA-binding NarL/FixJ family response regulator [Bacillus oleivorans]